MISQNKFISLIVVVMVAESVSSRAAPSTESPNTHSQLTVWTPQVTQSPDDRKDSVPPPSVSHSNSQDSAAPFPKTSNGRDLASPPVIAEPSSQRDSVLPPPDSQNGIIATLQVPAPIADEIKKFLAPMQDSPPRSQDEQSTMQNPQSAILDSQPAMQDVQSTIQNPQSTMQNLPLADGQTQTNLITSKPVIQPFNSKKDLEQFHFEQWTNYDLTVQISEVDFEVQIQSHFEDLPDEHLRMLCSKVGVLFDLTIIDLKKVNFDTVSYESFGYKDKTLKIKTMTCNCEKTGKNGKEFVDFHMGDSLYDETSAFVYFANEKGVLRPEAHVNALPLVR